MVGKVTLTGVHSELLKIYGVEHITYVPMPSDRSYPVIQFRISSWLIFEIAGYPNSLILRAMDFPWGKEFGLNDTRAHKELLDWVRYFYTKALARLKG